MTRQQQPVARTMHAYTRRVTDDAWWGKQFQITDLPAGDRPVLRQDGQQARMHINDDGTGYIKRTGGPFSVLTRRQPFKTARQLRDMGLQDRESHLPISAGTLI